MEVASFGTLSKLYSNIADNDIKKIISRSFQLPSYPFLENRMKCASVLRNCCENNILKLLSNHPLIDIKAMGFQEDWEEQLLWK